MSSHVKFIALIFIGASSVATCAQAQKRKASPTAKAPAVTHNLSDAFAVAALKALKTITDANDLVDVSEGQLVVPKGTKESIDNADANAVTSNERDVVSTLNSLYLLKLDTNLQVKLYMMKSYNPETELKQAAAADADPKIVSKRKYFTSCEEALDTILRSRNYTDRPSECALLKQ